MSVSDPLIKDVKGCVLQLINAQAEIDDNNFYFIFLAQSLEKIFNKGLIRQQDSKFFERTIDVYSWMISINDHINLTYQHCVDSVKERSDVSSNTGRFRLLTKYCLMKKCLYVPVQCLQKSQHAQVFYSQNSILADDILTEILLSLLYQVSKLPFNLDLKNASFLDISWCIPEVIDVEVVPCKSLGIAVSFTGDKAVIVNVEPDGVAAENGNIRIGDVLDQLNGVHITKSAKGRLRTITKCNKLTPIKLRIAKSYSKTSKQLFEPITYLLKELKLDVDGIRKQYEELEKDVSSNNKKNNFYGYAVKYLAEVNVGAVGNVKQVQKSLLAFTNPHLPDADTVQRLNRVASLEIGEIGLKIRDRESTDLILDHPYMKISSCGNLPLYPKMFGYCASDETCDVAKNFTCHIFETVSFDDADLILQSIGQGFHRTHFAV